MAEYIEREAALRAILGEPPDAHYPNWYAERIKALPAADVAPVVCAKWAHIGGDEFCCTNCGSVISTEGSWEKPTQKHCGECGARMNGGAEDEVD